MDPSKPIAGQPIYMGGGGMQSGEGGDSSSGKRPGGTFFKTPPIIRSERDIAEDQYNTDAWTTLMAEIENKYIEDVREYYEKFFAVFPTAGRYWQQYVEQELRGGYNDRAEKIFQRCMLKCPNVELWKSYLKYVKQMKEKKDKAKSGATATAAATTAAPTVTGAGSSTVTVVTLDVGPFDLQSEVVRAYEFALDHVGFDIGSTQIWTDYIEHLKCMKPTNDYERGQQIAALRKLYHRAVQNPMHGLEAIWKDYDLTENSWDKIVAKKQLTDMSPKYKAATNTYKERKSMREGLLVSMLARPPRSITKEEQQVTLWLRLIEFEKSNFQKVSALEVKRRVVFTYNQCLLCLLHYPDMWYEFTTFLADAGSAEEAKEVFKRGIEALPDNKLLYLASAEFEVLRNNNKEARAAFDKLRERMQDPLIDVHFLRFLQRAEGTQEARKAFMECTRKPSSTYHLFCASAQMELAVNKDPKVAHGIARKIFEMGLTKFSSEPMFLLEYGQFLANINDEENARAMFEKALTCAGDKSSLIWDAFLEFEYKTGDPGAIIKLEKRKAEACKEEYIASRGLVMRCSFLDLFPCNDEELPYYGITKTQNKGKLDQFSSSHKDDLSSAASRLNRPDVSQMVAFNPLVVAPPKPNYESMIFQGSSTTAVSASGLGASTSSLPSIPLPPLPESIARLLTILPHPQFFQGTMPDVGQLMDILQSVVLVPPGTQRPPATPSPTISRAPMSLGTFGASAVAQPPMPPPRPSSPPKDPRARMTAPSSISPTIGQLSSPPPSSADLPPQQMSSSPPVSMLGSSPPRPMSPRGDDILRQEMDQPSSAQGAQGGRASTKRKDRDSDDEAEGPRKPVVVAAAARRQPQDFYKSRMQQRQAKR